MLECLVEDFNCVICSATTGEGFTADNTGISETADVDVVAFEVIVTEEFSGDFGKAVHSFGFKDGFLRGVDAGCFGSEDRDGAGDKYAGHVMFTGDFEDVVEE